MVEYRYMTTREICLLTLFFGLGSGIYASSNFFISGSVEDIKDNVSEKTSATPYPPYTESEPPNTVSSTPPYNFSLEPTFPSSKISNFEESYILTKNEDLLFPDSLSVSLMAIHDSRCPRNVACIWVGELSPQLVVTGGEFGESVVTFLLGTERTQAHTKGNYTFTLDSVDHATQSIALTISYNPVKAAKPRATTVPAPKASILGASNIETKKPAVTTISTTDFTTEVTTLIEKMTAEFRKKESLPVFARDKKLAASATTYSRNMRTGDFFAHIDPRGCDLTCRFAESKYKAQSWGENLAMLEFDERPSAAYVANFFMTEWEASSGHRRNLLSPTFTHQGIGISIDKNSIYVVAHFALPNL